MTYDDTVRHIRVRLRELQRYFRAIAIEQVHAAVRGIGEAFATSPATGTGTLTIPIATSAGRGSLAPVVGLTYDSGSGNGPFGLGWTLGVPAINLATDKGVPRYRADDTDAMGPEKLLEKWKV